MVHADPPPPAALVPRLGPAVDAVIMRGLAKRSADRFPNVLAFVAALRQAIEGVPVTLAEATPEIAEMDEPPPVRAVDLDLPATPALALPARGEAPPVRPPDGTRAG